jgi:UDP-4-amino-4,6-dideoxy-N-acetyl-beta-L-altrosamine transaminase
MKPKFIPYGRQTISKSDVAVVLKVLQSNFITQGPQISSFERIVADYVGVAYGVAFSSGTAALHAACWAAGVTEGDEVITTPLTFAASANCILYCGGIPVFADIKYNVPLIDPVEIVKKISKRTKALIPVDYSGIPADYEELNQLAKKNNLTVIADAAHSLGGTYKNNKVGQLADMTVFSFHPVKTITTGEGGMVVTNNKKFYDRLVLFRTHGITKNKELLSTQQNVKWYYEMQDLGYNYRLTDFQAALGISQFKRLDKFIKKRQFIADIYLAQLKNLVGLDLISVPKNRTCAWHLFPILINQKKRDQIFNLFHKAGIGVQVHYIPVHMHPYYRDRFRYKQGDFPNAETFFERELSIPIFPKLTNSEIRYVIGITKSIISD